MELLDRTITGYPAILTPAPIFIRPWFPANATSINLSVIQLRFEAFSGDGSKSGRRQVLRHVSLDGNSME